MLPAVTASVSVWAKKALLLQNVSKLILQEISADLTLYNVWSHPVVRAGDGRTPKEKQWAPSTGY